MTHSNSNSPRDYVGGRYPEEDAPEPRDAHPDAPKRAPTRWSYANGVDADGEWYDKCPGFWVGE